MATNGSLLRSFRAHNYRLYFAGQLASMCGTWMQTVALSWLVLELTGAGTQVGGVIALQYGTLLLVSPLAGVRIDRMERRRIVIAAESFLALQATALAVVAFADVGQVWIIYVLAAAQGAGAAVEQPARQSLLSELVAPPDLPNAMALNAGLFHLSRIVGPAVAGAVIVVAGVAWCFAINAVSFVCIIAAVAAMRPDEMFHRPSIPTAPGQIREGMRYAAKHREIRMLVSTSFVTGTLVGGSSAAVLPLLASTTFDGDAGTFGLMGTVLGCGAAMASLWVATLTEVTTRLLMWITLGVGLSLLGVAAAPTLGIEFVVLVPLGGFTVVQGVGTLTRVQLVARAEARGRMVALYFMLSAAGSASGALVLGTLAQQTSPRWAFALNALLSLCLFSSWVVYHRVARRSGPVPHAVELS